MNPRLFWFSSRSWETDIRDVIGENPARLSVRKVTFLILKFIVANVSRTKEIPDGFLMGGSPYSIILSWNGIGGGRQFDARSHEPTFFFTCIQSHF